MYVCIIFKEKWNYTIYTASQALPLSSRYWTPLSINTDLQHHFDGHDSILSIGYIMICLSNLLLMNSQKGSNFCYKHYKWLYSFSDVTWRHISRSRRSDEGPFETINRIQVNPLEGSSSRIQNFFWEVTKLENLWYRIHWNRYFLGNTIMPGYNLSVMLYLRLLWF